jgi:nucleotide-binding universal stress UspA family protein
MHIMLCLDYSPFTEKVLATMQALVQSFKGCEVSVVHVIDETAFVAGTGFETQLYEDLKKDGEQLKKLSQEYLGNGIDFIEEYGIPRGKIDEILSDAEYDLLAIGSHSKNILGSRLSGSVAEHLLHNSKKPVLVIP